MTHFNSCIDSENPEVKKKFDKKQSDISNTYSFDKDWIIEESDVE